MIRDQEQAKSIQARRVSKGLHGHAKAVRRYGMSKHKNNYRAWIDMLPVKWK